MHIKLLTVSRSGYAADSKPRILFRGGWLSASGFIHGALVQVLPEPGGMVFNLRNENIESYSELFHATRGKGGSLIQVCIENTKDNKEATFVTSGKYIESAGFSAGDALIAGYGYGVIHVRKIDPGKLGLENVRVITVTHIRKKHAVIPKVRLSGGWLSGAGFTPDSLATAKSAPGILTLRLVDTDKSGYNALMKYLRGNGMKLVQASKEPHNRGETPVPCIGITGSIIDKTGFKVGDTLAASYEYGVIQLQKLDFDKLGF